MRIPRFTTDPGETAARPRQTAFDALILLAVLAAMVAIRWHAPVTTHAYAQFLQINASIDEINGGSWVLPTIEPARNEPAHKPQLYAWILSAAMLATDAKHLPPAVMELIFRTPTILAMAGLLWLTYLLGRRWYDRRVGLMAGVLLATMLHMNKFVFLATTDVLLAFWIAWCIFCADRLTFHPADSSPAGGGAESARRRGGWAVAFWMGMIFAAITKGWGIVNLALLGGWLAFAGCLGPGFAALRRCDGPTAKAGLTLRLLWRRAWALMRRVHLGWGLLAMVAFSVPLWWAMLDAGGEEFRETVYFEVVQRLTGEGDHAPDAMGGPAVAHLYYNTLPASLFAGCALFLAPLLRNRMTRVPRVCPHTRVLDEREDTGLKQARGTRMQWVAEILRSWLGYRSPIALPMWWIVTVVLAFAVPAGFRGDYLLPCYPAVALLAGWAARELTRPARYAQGVGKHLRRICQASPLVIGITMFAAATVYLVGLGGQVDWLPMPDMMPAGTWLLLAAVPVAAMVAVGLGVLGIWHRRLSLTVAGCVVGMLAVVFCYSQLWSRQARTGDGEVIIGFAERAKPVIGDQPFVNLATLKLGADAYLGHFGWDPRWPKGKTIDRLNASDIRYAVVCDRVLLELGAYHPDHGDRTYRIKLDGEKRFFDTAPESLGRVLFQTAEPVEMEDWGRMYLIELRRPMTMPAPPIETGYISDESGEL